MKRLVLTLAISLAFALVSMAQASFTFDDGILYGWTTIDADGDGNNWQLSTNGGLSGNVSDGMVLSYSLDGATGDSLTPDNYFVSPRVTLSQENSYICFYARALDESHPAEHFGVAISTTVNNDPSAFTMLQDWTLHVSLYPDEWIFYTVGLSQYAGQEVYLAFRHYPLNGMVESAVRIDDIYIEGELIDGHEIWNPLNLPGTLKGVNAQGDLYSISSDTYPASLVRSHDDGETWETVFTDSFGNMAIGDKGRIFLICDRIVNYSDDNGDTWQQTSPINNDTGYNWFSCMDMRSPSNDTLVGYSSPYLIWTLDGGATWDSTRIAIMEDHQEISDLLVNENGDVYVSIWYYVGSNIGVYHFTLSDMRNWELVAFQGYSVRDMDFDPDGNVVCGVYGGFSGFEHIPGFYAVHAKNVGIADNGIVYRWNMAENNSAVLAYSFDHGENFTEIGEALPLAEPAPGGEDGFLSKGHDNHLYFYGNGLYYKSRRNADNIQTSGVLTRVSAPYFEQNASDNRLAIVKDNVALYITVNGYWPNPDADELIVNSATIPLGSEIEAVGTYSIMHDENGDSFRVFDIERLENPTYQSVIGYLMQGYFDIESTDDVCAWYLGDQSTFDEIYRRYGKRWIITINGEMQTELELPDFNGIQLTDSIRYTLTGIPDSIIDYYGHTVYLLELTNVIPYEPNFTANGSLTLQSDLYLSTPCVDTPCLLLDEGDQRHYLTLVDKMQHNYINDDLFDEGVQTQIHGIETTHYDLFGAPFNTLDILEMETSIDSTMVGAVVNVPNPPIGANPPFDLELAFKHNDVLYYTPNVHEWWLYETGPVYGHGTYCYVVDNDTLFVGKEVTAQFTTSSMRIGNNLKPYYWVNLNHADYYDHIETLHGRLVITNELYDYGVYAFVTDDNEAFLIEPYFIGAAMENELAIGQDTLHVGSSFTVTGEVFQWHSYDFYSPYQFKGINILEISDIGATFPLSNEWYYEIENENGSITYQHLYQSGDTIVNDEPTQILVKINTLYDKGLRDEVMHEYIQERDGKVYWWNKTLEEFTVLYDFGAQEGDTWVTKVGTETLTMHVDAVETVEYEGKTYRMLRVSDADDIFSGDIVCGIGHLTSFFPERLMNNRDGILVEGLRCYWIEDELVFQPGDEDCDAVISELHGVEEDGPSTGSGALTVYPNPTDGTLFVQTLRATSLPDQTYRITNLMGQTVLTGQITAENQQIDVSSLPQGMYFITFAGETRKFVVR